MNTEQLTPLIGEAVIKNTQFSGTLNNTYNVHDLMHNCNLPTLDKMYQALVAKKNKAQTGTLAGLTKGTSTVRTENSINKKIEIITGIYQFRVAEKERLDNAKEARLEAAKKAELLKGILDKKELEKYEGMSLDEVKAELAKVEA